MNSLNINVNKLLEFYNHNSLILRVIKKITKRKIKIRNKRKNIINCYWISGIPILNRIN